MKSKALKSLVLTTFLAATMLLLLSAVQVTVTAADADVEINEIVAEPYGTPEANYEWVEIINTGDSAVDVSGWNLTDGTDVWQVPAATPSLNQWDCFVFNITEHCVTPPLPADPLPFQDGGLNLSNAVGTLIDSVYWYRIYSGQSLAQIYDDGSLDLWVGWWGISKGYSNFVHSSPPLKLNEVLYDDDYDNPDPNLAEEWIEIYNRGGSAVDLTGWGLGRQGGSGVKYLYPLTNASATIGAWQHLVIWEKTHFAAYYNDHTVGFKSMTDNYGVVGIHNPNGQCVDMLVYTFLFSTEDAGQAHWAYEAPDVPEAHSLERSPAGKDTDKDSDDFIDQDTPSPCTLIMPGVGGHITPIDKLLMIMPWIGLASAIAIAAATTAITFKKRRP